MTHYSYLEELEKKAKKSQFYWLGFIGLVLLAVIAMLVIIRRETSFFVRVQEIEKKPLTSEEKKGIEKRVLAVWAKRELGIEEQAEIESKILGVKAEARVLTDKDKREIESRLE
jgi:hypothetical protein